jgi:hypothetical protein
VQLLQLGAAIFNTSYEAINIWIFYIMANVVFSLDCKKIYLKRRLRDLKKVYYEYKVTFEKLLAKLPF